MNMPPVIPRESLATYLRNVADWLEQEPLTIDEFSIKQWSNIGTVHINFKVTNTNGAYKVTV